MAKDVRWRYLSVAAAALVFGSIIVFSFSNLTDQKRVIARDSFVNIWFIAQMEIEYHRLMETLHVYGGNRQDVSHSELMKRFDIFWSRLPILLNGPQSAKLRNIEGFEDTIEGIIAILEEVEPIISSLRRDDVKNYRVLVDKFEPIKPPMHQLVLNVLAQDNKIYENEKKELDNLFKNLILYLGVTIVAGVLIFVLFYREIGRAQRHFKEAREAEANARRARAQLAAAIESISEGFILYDSDDRVVLYNSRYEDLHPFQAQFLEVGSSFADLLRFAIQRGGVNIPDGQTEDEWIAEQVQSHLHPQEAFETQLSDGSWLKISERRTVDGWIVGVHTDITELKLRETQLAEQSQLLQSTLENITHGVCVFDSGMKLLAWNALFLKMFDIPAETAKVGWPYGAFIRHCAESGEFGPGALQPLAEFELEQATKRHFTGEGGRMERARPDGTFLELRWRPMPGGGVVKSYLDITDRIEAEDERTRLLDQFHASQRMEAMGTMAGGIAHDFNNILGSILGNADMLLEDMDENDPAFPRLNQVVNSGLRAKELVAQILSYSRKQEHSSSPVRLDELLHEVLGLMRATLPSTTSIVPLNMSDASVLADSTQIHQVLVNLLVNASHAIGEEPGTIEVGIDEIVLTAKDQSELMEGASSGASGTSWTRIDEIGGKTRMYLGLPEPGTYLRVRICDSGCGVERAQMSRIFEPFYTTKDVGKGSGLGLAAVHGIVANHNGTIVVESSVDQGTTFEIYFPMLEQNQLSATINDLPCGPASETARSGAGEWVLMVDDDVALLEVGKITLEQAGYNVSAKSNGRDALMEFSERPEKFDIVITDKTMPGMSGDVLANEILRIRQGIPVIMWTGFIDAPTEESAKHQGIAEVLIKPVVGGELSSAVRRVLDGR